MKLMRSIIYFGITYTLLLSVMGSIEKAYAQEVKREREVRVRPAPKPIDATPRREIQVRSREDAIAHKRGFKPASPKVRALEDLKVKVAIPKQPKIKVVKPVVEVIPTVEPVKQIQVKKTPALPKMPIQTSGEARNSFFQELIERYFT